MTLTTQQAPLSISAWRTLITSLVSGGIACAHRASKAHLRLQVGTLQAKVRDLKGMTVAREGYMQE